MVSPQTELWLLDRAGTNLINYGSYLIVLNSAKIHHNTIQNLVSIEFGPMGIYFASEVTASHIYNNTIINIGVASEWGIEILIIVL